MNQESEILQKLFNILKDQCQFEGNELAPEQRIQEDLGLDSMQMIAMLVEIENFYRIHLNEDLSHPPQTLGELAKLIAQRLSESK